MAKKLLTDNDFIQLKHSLNLFDPFRVLGVVRSENRHSNVLAWLLDPNGNHQIKDEFINNFLRSVLLYNDCDKEFPNIKLYSYVEYDEIYDEHTLDFNDVKIIREWSENGNPEDRRIDILGISEEHKLVFFIENKIDSTKGSKQLEDCYNIVKRCFDGYTILPIFLTLDYEELSGTEEMYKTFSYDHLSYLIQRSTKDAETVKTFILHYLNILEELTVLKENVFNQCQSLNNNHKAIIDNHTLTRDLSLEDKSTIKFLKFNQKINNRIFKRASRRFAENFRHTVNGYPKQEYSNIAHKYNITFKEFWFTNSGWLKPYLWKTEIPPNALMFKDKKWPLPYPISFKFIRKENKLTLQLLCSPEELFKEYFPDKTLEDLLKLLEEHAQSKYADELNYILKKPYHILWKISEDFTDWGNVNSLYSKMSDMYLETGGKNHFLDQTLLFDLHLVLKELKEGPDSL
ncbi:PD-(D/E)XK nuclease family protein [Priestia sp. YIM B13551]|uniref:PDDEXK-like family protein n=1 Tax=Priestia sp. YIM B13551 TaxID=3366306 RepID=UPI003670524A